MKKRRFEKVSYEQFKKDFKNLIGINTILKCGGNGFDYNNVANEAILKHIYDNIKMPVRKTKNSAGYDISVPIPITLPEGKTVTFPTGIKICGLADDEYLAIHIRSSIGFRHDVILSNATGVIDADYEMADNEGHIWVKLINHGCDDLRLNPGDGVCQGIISKYLLADGDSLEDGNERRGGIGSTDLAKACEAEIRYGGSVDKAVSIKDYSSADLSDGWNPWCGNEKGPIDGSVYVDALFRNGNKCKAMAADVTWYHKNVDGDVIAWRLSEGRDGWIEWIGSDKSASTFPPDIDNKMVDCKYSDGEIKFNIPAYRPNWQCATLIAYRIVRSDSE